MYMFFSVLNRFAHLATNFVMYAKHCSCYVWVTIRIFILGGGHFGRDKTLQKVCSRFFWHSVHADVRSYVRSCDKCQRTNAVLKKQPGQLHPISIHPQVCKRVGVDLIVSLTANIQLTTGVEECGH